MNQQFESKKVDLECIPYCEHTIMAEEINEVIDTH
jgi:hypothetical protein